MNYTHDSYRTSLNADAIRIASHVAILGDRYYGEIVKETGLPLHVVRYQCSKLASRGIITLTRRGPLVIVHSNKPRVRRDEI